MNVPYAGSFNRENLSARSSLRHRAIEDLVNNIMKHKSDVKDQVSLLAYLYVAARFSVLYVEWLFALACSSSESAAPDYPTPYASRRLSAIFHGLGVDTDTNTPLVSKGRFSPEQPDPMPVGPLLEHTHKDGSS